MRIIVEKTESFELENKYNNKGNIEIETRIKKVLDYFNNCMKSVDFRNIITENELLLENNQVLKSTDKLENISLQLSGDNMDGDMYGVNIVYKNEIIKNAINIFEDTNNNRLVINLVINQNRVVYEIKVDDYSNNVGEFIPELTFLVLKRCFTAKVFTEIMHYDIKQDFLISEDNKIELRNNDGSLFQINKNIFECELCYIGDFQHIKKALGSLVSEYTNIDTLVLNRMANENKNTLQEYDYIFVETLRDMLYRNIGTTELIKIFGPIANTLLDVTSNVLLTSAPIPYGIDNISTMKLTKNRIDIFGGLFNEMLNNHDSVAASSNNSIIVYTNIMDNLFGDYLKVSHDKLDLALNYGDTIFTFLYNVGMQQQVA